MKLKELEKEIEKLANPEKSKILQKFFKTGKGEYGEGDVFLGISGGDMRKIAKEFRKLNTNDIQKLLDSKINEKRSIALLILTEQYRKTDNKGKKRIVDLYLKNTKNINNWNLVDISAPHILGNYLIDKDRKILYQLAVSENLWEKRISIVATFAFIRNNDFNDCLKISEILLNNRHDLIHKAVGWMLREVWKKDNITVENFIKKHYSTIPRTSLRYAIERFEENKRKRYLKGEF
ncbi:DNA alkylation repair protein [Candidatus Pacearchaeota archaeon]|nr:DNA alkylation repair protein [Candidatus Pacearchaeota archaeon]MBD3283640.1 DNA alkylation repair protein [Candidatus Pacearchaeota archaeon]